jgi:hypothetical protein
MKVVILVMSSELERYPELVLKQQTTWDADHHQEIETIFYYSSYKTDLVGNKLHVDIPELLGYFYNKTMIAFEKLLMYKWDYIFKTDNSTYINKEVLLEILRNKPRENYYGGHLYQTTYAKTAPFLWGEGFALSRDVVQYLVKEYKGSAILRSGVEDVHIGMVLKDKFEWDTSLTIQSYHPSKSITPGHVYRCRNDLPTGIKFTDDLLTMQVIHECVVNNLYEAVK